MSGISVRRLPCTGMGRRHRRPKYVRSIVSRQTLAGCPKRLRSGDAARTEYEAVEKLAPGRMVLVLELAEALEILEGLLAGQPRLAAAHLLLAQLLLAAGETARAQVHTAKAAREGNATAEAILLHAGILVRTGALEEAERQLGRLAAVDPDSRPVAELRARILAARGKAAEAVAGLESAFAEEGADGGLPRLPRPRPPSRDPPRAARGIGKK